MANFQVLDAYGSVITIQSSTFGSAERQIVGASILGVVPVNFSGSPSISGAVTVVSTVAIGNTPTVNPNPASVQVLNPVSILAVTQSGAWTPSAIGYTTRNDAVASFLGANLTTRPAASDSAGRTLVKPFAPEESRIEGTIALTSTSVTTVIAAPGAGLRNYITDFMIANSGSVTTLVTFKDGAGSVLGYTIAPATGGSNAPGLATPIRTGANATFDIQAAGFTSTLYGTFTGFKAP